MASDTEPPLNEKKTGSGSQNYYDILGITQQATDEEIKRAYRKAALRLHPDKNPDPAAPAQFQEVDKAYKTLSDPNLRSIYDRLGPSAADAARRAHDEYSEAWNRMPKWKKILFTVCCIGTCGCFGLGCCCLCCCGCCCQCCCNHCCGKYKPDNDSFSPFPENEDVPGTQTQTNDNETVNTPIINEPKETDPIFGSSNEHSSDPMPPSYESTLTTKTDNK